MTLLLKSMWRSVIRSSSFSRSTLSSRSLSSNVAEVTRPKPQDAVMSMIKSAPNAAEVLAAVQTHLPVMTHKHMLQALRCLFELQKSGNFYNNPDELVKNPAFGVLCQNFKKHARSLDVSEAIEATKVLSFLGVPVDSLIVQTMLQIIRHNINLVNLRQIMFLDFILGRFEKSNHLVDALKLALPLAFQIHLPLELDNQDLSLLKDMLSYSSSHDLPDRCINNVVTGLLLHDQRIDAHAAKSIIWSLCQVNCTESVFPTRVQLLHICFDILTQCLDELSYDEVLRTVAKLKGRIMEKHPEYYHEQLMDAIAEYVIRNDVEFEKCLLVARVLSRVAHTHLDLVEHICQLAVSSPVTLANARTNILFGFINCLSNNNYCPEDDQWTELKRQISLNPVLNAKNAALPWTKICLELASLGHYDDKLLDRVFSKDFLDEYLAREQNTLDYLQLMTLHEAVNTFHSKNYKLPQDMINTAKAMHPVNPLTEQMKVALAQGLGGPEYVVKNVILPNGIVSDLLVCLKNCLPIKLPIVRGDYKVPIEHLKLPQDGVVVCILNFKQGCFSMNSNRLRGTFRLIIDILNKQGYAALPMNITEWLNAPAHERTPYLMREVGYRCEEMGMKLTAT